MCFIPMNLNIGENSVRVYLSVTTQLLEQDLLGHLIHEDSFIKPKPTNTEDLL